MVLFFVFGVVVVLVKFDFVIFEVVVKVMVFYFMLVIGFKGGVEVVVYGFDVWFFGILLVGVFLSVIVFFIGFVFLWLIVNLFIYDVVVIVVYYGLISIVMFVVVS